MAVDAQRRRLALQAVRGACLALHSAAGLTMGIKDVERLLRAAEGIARTAAATLGQRTPQPEPTEAEAATAPQSQARGKPNEEVQASQRQEGAMGARSRPPPQARAPQGAGTSRSARRRRRRRLAGAEEQMDLNNENSGDNVGDSALSLADGSVLRGDLSELGIPAGTAVVQVSGALSSADAGEEPRPPGGKGGGQLDEVQRLFAQLGPEAQAALADVPAILAHQLAGSVGGKGKGKDPMKEGKSKKKRSNG